MNFNPPKNVIMFVLVLCFAAMMGFNLIYKSNKNKMLFIDSQVEEEKKKNELLMQMQILEKKYKAFSERSFTSTEVAPLLDKISSMANESGIVLETFSPLSLERKQNFVGVPLSIPFKAEYHDVGKFISLLESSKEFFMVQKLKIKKGGLRNQKESNVPQINLTIAGFYMEP